MVGACTRQRRPQSPSRFAPATVACIQHLKNHHPLPSWLERFCWWDLFRLLPVLADLPPAMASEPPGALWTCVRPPRPWDPPGSRRWSRPAAGRAWDLFGSSRTAWSDHEDAAWDCFGFLVYNSENEGAGVQVLVQQTPGRQRSCLLTPGEVTGLYGLWDLCENPYLTVQRRPRHSEICGFGLELVASVRAVKHWVSRWRRGLRVLRRRNASMVLADKLPGVPEVVKHVHSFL